MQTATNPQTGEKLTWNGQAWVPAGAPAAPAATVGPITVGTPRPEKPKIQQVGGSLGIVDEDTGSFTPTYTPPDKPEKDPKLTDSEKAAAGFYRRALNTHRKYGKGILPRNVVSQTLIDGLPDAFENTIDSPERREMRNLAEEFIRSKLRKESGAVIGAEEMAQEFRVYFPVPGDTQEDLDRKAGLREEALAGLKLAAGDYADGAVADLDMPTSDEDVRKALEERIAKGDAPQDTIKWLVSINRPPTPEQIDAIFANQGNARPDVRSPDGSVADGVLHNLGVGARGVVQGVGDIANLVSSPFIQGVNAVAGTNYNPDMGDIAADALGLPEPQNNAENLAHQVNRFGTGALSMAGVAGRAAPYTGQVVGNALARFSNAPLTDAVAGSTGGASSELTRQSGGGPIAQTTAGIIGGAASLPVSARVNAMINPVPRSTPAIVSAGRQEGVTVNRAMVDPDAQQRVTAVGKTMLGGRRMQRDMREVGGQIEGGVQRLGRNEEAIGQAVEPEVGGQIVRDASDRFIKTSGQKLGRRYDALESEVGSVKVTPTQSLGRVDEAIARLGELGETNKAEISYLQGLKKDLGKDLSVGALRRLRTTLRKRISKGELTFGEDEATVLSIMDTAAEDIAAGLSAAGKKGVAERFRRVDADYRDRMEFINGTVQRIIGKRGANVPPGQIMANLKALTSPKGDNAGFARMMREMTPEEQADIAATFAEGLGKNSNGEFSTAFLVKHLEKLPKSVRIAAFGPEGAKSLENLDMLAREHARVTKALGGSPTAVGNDYRSYLLNLAFGGGTFAAGGANLGSAMTGAAVAVGGAGIKGGRDLFNARLLMSSDIQKWLKNAPRTTDAKAINSHFDRLKSIAAREPALGEEIRQLQQMMMRAANENVAQTGRAAASPNERPESDK